MSDAPIAVTVRNVRRQPVDLGMDVDDEGYIVLTRGMFTIALDPELDLPDLQNMLEVLRRPALKKRAARTQPKREQP